jgi:Protein of unknown function (DUF1360).
VLILVLIVAVLATARVTRLLVEDRITSSYRAWVVRKRGENSLASYFVHCPWCMSIWISAAIMPIAVAWPNRWVLGVLSVPAASYLTGFIAAREDRS